MNSYRIIHDFWDASECFDNVEIKGGVCYFLWKRDDEGICEFFTHNKNKVISKAKRELVENKYE